MSERFAGTDEIDFENGKVEMAFGAGGRAAAGLFDQLFLPEFSNSVLAAAGDGAVVSVAEGDAVISTDCHIVSPIFFPGGDIGSLAVAGSVNDVAMMGAAPAHLTVGFILEEGFPLAGLRRIVASMAATAREAGVEIVAGDTKVVERGACDGVFITTTCLGSRPPDSNIGPAAVRAGDAIILSGSIAEHGIAVLSQRENLDFETAIRSDCAPLNGLVDDMLATGLDIHCLRDPTRGGVAAALNEILRPVSLGCTLEETAIPIAFSVRTACDFLGMDPLQIANEGKLIAFCPADEAHDLVATMRGNPLAKDAAVIGLIDDRRPGMVEMVTAVGGRRVVDWLYGETLPRIC